ncbi:MULTISPECIES: TIGR02594 family protein [unclassified Novosphingobium]|uniref:TIGR02594 family protein n=1 Tax=unclassified Novosphingobium TaxID=2644732 RepID=UPI001441512D|nr:MULTISPECIES: TIGR02594 family protein [unclassified Novosphingobium]MBB3359188.1 uncharacterized protein (TIGR02594 family) [Novosphingobium sp. BK256]MBB3375331.1 uncharacterized protein (TIGR02594 family) [Novosphingobium sp. BK280]MBB3379960.1 uncharacterized protein (TIGR02594 family) [Novosphingobium sp. BK258]MBB3421655.1 uncharacterized protein (TIGR02594 family) [Novosphingobium sp. BK267]MBB3449970.1 uncharacterized protein (TIGR02594 family) [Novosphingobium sp. BK352]
MPVLPPAYRWLATLKPLPRMLREGLALIDTAEQAGPASNPVILAWAAEIGGDVARAYRADSTAWCGLFMALVAQRAGKPLPANPLWALNWARFGGAAAQPMLGDVLVFQRSGGGHVGLCVAQDEAAYHVLGGNQGDRVSIARIARHRLYAARRPDYRIMPTTVRAYGVAECGTLSTNEA